MSPDRPKFSPADMPQFRPNHLVEPATVVPPFQAPEPLGMIDRDPRLLPAVTVVPGEQNIQPPVAETIPTPPPLNDADLVRSIRRALGGGNHDQVGRKPRTARKNIPIT